MIILEVCNRAVEEILSTRFEQAKEESRYDKIDYTIADFDSIVYTITNPNNDKKKILVSIFIRFFAELEEHGVKEVLAREYGNLLSSTEPNQSVTLCIDLENLPQDHNQLAHKCSLLKRNCMAAVFEKFFEFQIKSDVNSGSKRAVIHYRNDETMYVQALADRVTVIFSTTFKDPDDLLLGKAFMQEFTEVRRRLDRAPQVLYSHRVPPKELQGTDAAVSDSVAYITFVLFSHHLTTESTRNSAIDLIQTLRNYLHYHIKCSKASIQMRMRAKTLEFLKVLNRAHIEHSTNSVIHPNEFMPSSLLSVNKISGVQNDNIS
uniref:Arp2/3 complex 34 kDa subunit n=1 Tax=Schistosoma japonicum TaxID=6182 RepID=C1L4E5_SCHJA|nr:actin related protein 2/3 complex, subunit 2 [Schistosoma japonicum]